MGIQMVSFLAIIVLASPLLAVSRTNNNPLYPPVDNLINLEDIMDKETAAIVWTNCGTELTHLMEAFQDLEFSSNQETHLEQDKRLNSLALDDLHIKKTIFDCLNVKSINFPESGQENPPRKWYMEYLHYFSLDPNQSHRTRRLAETNAPAPAPSPGFSPSPSPSPGPSPSAAPSFMVPPSAPFFPVLPRDPGSGEATEAPIGSSANQQSNNGNNDTHKKIIIAVVTTATTTFFLAALIFCCYTRTCGKRRGQNDERPLLSLSMSDYSINGGSYKPSYNLSNSMHKVGSMGNEALYANSNIHNMDSSIPLGIPLQLPPGRVESSLRPPPGRVESSKRLPVNTAPPPPVPPPAPKPPTARPPPPPPPSSGPRPPPPPSGGPRPPPPPSGGPRPPPPPSGGPRPPLLPSGGPPPPRPPGANLRPPRPFAAGPSNSNGDEASKAKLKPFFWDKVMANPDQSMVWHQIKSGSFQFSEEMIETLFGYNNAAADKSNDHSRKNSQDPTFQYVQIIDPKKAQNLSILLKALNVTTEEICDALKEGNELPAELVQTLIKMAPTTDEEQKLRMYNGDISHLGTAERFLKTLIEIPFAFKRLESLLFMCTFQEEESMIKESFATLESACVELKKSRLFLKLLEAVLKTGNRMNDGTFRGSAQAFKLDTLLKLSDVKGIDGKTTLLHFVVQEIIRSEGVKAVRTTRESKSFKTDDLLKETSSTSEETEERYRVLGLQVVSGLSSELENVKKAAIIDADGLTSLVSRLGRALVKAREFMNSDLKKVEANGEGFNNVLVNFVTNADKEIMWMIEEEKRIMTLIKSTADYFHGNSGKDEGLRLFVIVRDFLIILDKVCKEVKSDPVRTPRTHKNDDVQVQSKNEQSAFAEQRQRLFPAIVGRRMDSSSSDED
ncbi:formin-like protein 3 [Rutidosis leptorrhynchoides]|uniref:formin-like protein 3 n=1 Tax=Rutidosis leptorrhynchoides TaxID=125765 RepID=UPI003A99F772